MDQVRYQMLIEAENYIPLCKEVCERDRMSIVEMLCRKFHVDSCDCLIKGMLDSTL